MKKRLMEYAVDAVACILVSALLVGIGRYHILRAGNRYHAPVVCHILSGATTYLDAFGVNEERPWELADTYASGGGTFSLPGMELRVWKSACVWENIAAGYAGTVLPNRGYLILDLYDLDDIKAYPLKEGSIEMREYDLEVREVNGGFIVTVR